MSKSGRLNDAIDNESVSNQGRAPRVIGGKVFLFQFNIATSDDRLAYMKERQKLFDRLHGFAQETGEAILDQNAVDVHGNNIPGMMAVFMTKDGIELYRQYEPRS